MTPDRNFEKDLFALYGEEAPGWADGGVTDRVIREIDRELRVRRRMMAVAAVTSALFSIGLLTAFAGPLVASAAKLAGAPASVLWATVLLGAAAFSWATARLAAEA
jgi:hypothetical protein